MDKDMDTENIKMPADNIKMPPISAVNIQIRSPKSMSITKSGLRTNIC